ncbi:hypothetical protein D0862_15301 [Hortaea werneckii]|uniref:DNA-directed RNA polymerase II subunit RPB9-like zinc ribbon domain-containing protein n=1 Tax=Hortaea werneckii TaxID=91943 RepID=A0A3M7DLH6_HORWE|nr:hypothetical protein D0862_15301 [Hortaea werneckii]
MLLFCPSCSNMLIISTIPHDHDGTHGGKNRFECRTCPYQMILDRKYYERKNMDLKGAEDVLGGADSWKNVDQAESTFLPSFFRHIPHPLSFPASGSSGFSRPGENINSCFSPGFHSQSLTALSTYTRSV